MTQYADIADSNTNKEIADEIRDDIPAFLNGEPGKRGGSVSVPFTRFDN